MKIKKFKTILLFAILFIAVCNYVYSEEILINNTIKYLKIGKNLSVYEDKSKNLKFEEVISKEFKSMKRDTFHSGYTNSIYWFKGSIINNFEDTKFLIGGMRDSYGKPTLYYTTNGKSYFKKESLKSDGIYKERLDKSDPAIEVNINKGEKMDFFICIDGKGSVIRCKFCIESPAVYLNGVENILNFDKIIPFIVALLSIIAIYLYFVFKSKVHLFFMVYLLLELTFIVLSSYRLKIEAIIVNYTTKVDAIMHFIYGTFRVLALTMLFLFIRELLGLRKEKWFNYICYLVLLTIGFSYFFLVFDFINLKKFLTFANFSTLTWCGTILTASILNIKKSKMAKYIAASFGCLFMQNLIFNFEVFTKSIIIAISQGYINRILICTNYVFLLLVTIFFVNAATIHAQEMLIKNTNDFVEALGYLPNLEKVIGSLLASLRKNIFYSRAYVYIAENNKHKFLAAIPDVLMVNKDQIEGLELFLNDLKKHKNVIINEMFEAQEVVQKVKIYDCESLLVMPLFHNNKYYGSLILMDNSKGMFNQETINQCSDKLEKIASVIEKVNKKNKIS